jgi:hypothetical protein
MAPGCERTHPNYEFSFASIWSTASPDTYYGMCGTSSSAPIVSGTIALMWEQFRKEDSNASPLPSTFKAILIHTADDINLPGPDFRSGYGRINTEAAIDLIVGACPNSVILEDEVSTDEVDSYRLYVPPGIVDMKVTLVWDDEAGTPGAAKELINDLDVNLVDPCGVAHYPWLLDHNNPANPATTGIDRLNNMEQVYVTTPLAGTWTINVTGYSVPNPVQDYSLVYQIEDGDSIADWKDNCPWAYNPEQNDVDADGIGDICECDRANIDHSDTVDFEDYSILALNWSLTGPCLQADLNRDESVGFKDLAQIAQHWLSYCD